MRLRAQRGKQDEGRVNGGKSLGLEKPIKMKTCDNVDDIGSKLGNVSDIRLFIRQTGRYWEKEGRYRLE